MQNMDSQQTWIAIIVCVVLAVIINSIINTPSYQDNTYTPAVYNEQQLTSMRSPVFNVKPIIQAPSVLTAPVAPVVPVAPVLQAPSSLPIIPNTPASMPSLISASVGMPQPIIGASMPFLSTPAPATASYVLLAGSQDHYIPDSLCPSLKSDSNVTLPQAEATCGTTSGCTAFNYGNNSAVYRSCTVPPSAGQLSKLVGQSVYVKH